MLDQPPTVAAGLNQTVNQGSAVTVDGTFSDPGFVAGVSAASYPATINWGDGTSTDGMVTLSSAPAGGPVTGTITGSHIYSDQGQYPVTVLVADAGGGGGTGSFTAQVVDVGPTLAPLPAGVPVIGQAFTLTEVFTEPGIAPHDSVVINWGDGNIDAFDADSLFVTSTGAMVPFITEPTATSPGSIILSHTYNNPGPFTLTVTLTDKDGKSSTKSEVLEPQAGSSTSAPTSSTQGTSVYGQPVTFSATVSDLAPATATPAGSVEFLDTTTNMNLGTVSISSAGVATLTTAALPVGTHSIEAIYLGNASFLGSTSTAAVSQTVGQAATDTTAPTSPSSVSFGQSVNLSARVTAQAPSTMPVLPPSGTVDFYDTTTGVDLTPKGVPLVNGSASLGITTLPVGTQTITETYSGDSNFTGSNTSASESVVVAIYALNSSAVSPSLAGTLYLSSGASINIPGRIIVDSPASPAVTLTGTSRIVAGSVGVVGKANVASTASITPSPTTGITAVLDPLASLALPTATGTSTPVSFASGSMTIAQGVYSGISVSGTGSLMMQPGVYVIAGGAFSVADTATVTGVGVTIYLAGSSNPAAGGTYGGITLSTTGAVNLSAPATGTDAGMLFFQARTNPTTITISGGAVNLAGTIYAADALLSMNGSAQIKDALDVNRTSRSAAIFGLAAPDLASPEALLSASTMPAPSQTSLARARLCCRHPPPGFHRAARRPRPRSARFRGLPARHRRST